MASVFTALQEFIDVSDALQPAYKALAAEVEKHRNGADPNDDLTMMCVKL